MEKLFKVNWLFKIINCSIINLYFISTVNVSIWEESQVTFLRDTFYCLLNVQFLVCATHSAHIIHCPLDFNTSDLFSRQSSLTTSPSLKHIPRHPHLLLWSLSRHQSPPDSPPAGHFSSSVDVRLVCSDKTEKKKDRKAMRGDESIHQYIHDFFK